MTRWIWQRSRICHGAGNGNGNGNGNGGGEEAPVSFVDSDAVGTADGNDSVSWDLSVDIGSGTGRKIISGIMYEYDSGGSTIGWSVTFDPGGDDEAFLGNITGGTATFAASGFTTETITRRIDIDDAVSGGQKTVRFSQTEDGGGLAAAFGAVSVQDAASGDPEAVALETGSDMTSISPTITTGEANTLVIDFMALNGSDTPSVDDGQTQRHSLTGANNVESPSLGGGISTVESGSAQTLDMGWSWENSSSRNTHVAVSVGSVDGGGGEAPAPLSPDDGQTERFESSA